MPSWADEFVDEEELEVPEMTEPPPRTTWGGMTPRLRGMTGAADGAMRERAEDEGGGIGEVYESDILAKTLVIEGPLVSRTRGGAAGAR